jgi:hypothetical protein
VKRLGFGGQRATSRGIALVVLMAALPHVALAHQDRIITLASDGRLEGFPATYEPAYLLLPPATGRGQVVLQLAGKRLDLPDCLSVLFAKTSRAHMRMAASWYHDPKVLPYYLSIDLPQRAPSAHGFYDGWSILVDITRMKVLNVKAVFAIGDTAQSEQEVHLETFCASGGTTELIGAQLPR